MQKSDTSAILLKSLEKILKPYSYKIECAGPQHTALFDNDLNEADKRELERTHFNNWHDALTATLASTGPKFCVDSSRHEGALIFGVTPFANNAGRIWMLQSKSFAMYSAKIHEHTLRCP